MHKIVKRWALCRAVGYRAPPRLTPLRIDALAFFPEVGLAVNRIKKSGNSSLVLSLNDLVGGPSHATARACKSARTWKEMPLSLLSRADRLRWLIVLRDPAARALSGFLDKVGSGTHPDFAGYAGYGRATPDGFAAFLADLATRPPRGTDRHFWPQVDLLVRPMERFDHVARLETLSRDMPAVLSAVGLDPAEAHRFARPHPVERAEEGKITSRPDMGAFLTPARREEIARLYARDFAALDIDPARVRPET